MNLNELAAQYAPTACKGIMLAVGMSGAVIFGVAIHSSAMSPFAAFGAMIALHLTPRHGVAARMAGALAGCIFLLLAASLSVAVAGFPLLALIFLFALSWLAALPKQDLAYLSFVAKCGAIAVLLSYFDFTPSLVMGVYFCSGILLGLFLSLANIAFEKENQLRPLDQLRALLHGDINNPYYALSIPATVIISSLLAQFFSFANAAWVGLTVIFVANADDLTELKRVLDRVVGTIAGTALSYLILRVIHEPLQLALIVSLLAFFLPFSIKRYSLFSFIITTIVLILIDIAMFGHGGDMGLLLWRCVDTIFGCLCVLVANLSLRCLRRHKKPLLKSASHAKTPAKAGEAKIS